MRRLHLPALVAALGLAACADASPVPTAPSMATDGANDAPASAASARTTASARWNLLTREVIRRGGGNSNDAARTFALVSVARYDAVIAAEDAKSRGMHPSESAAAAAAPAAVLTGRYPDLEQFIADQLAAEVAFFPTHRSERHRDLAAGMAVGRTVGRAVLDYAATDGAATAGALPGPIPTGDGVWVPPAPPALPQQPSWGAIRPWLLESADQFRSAPPPTFGSPEFLAALAEVRHFSDTRTPGQLAIAQFWNSGYGPGGPAGYFGTLATQLAARQHLDERRTARLLAVLHMAIMDASIACYDAKYFYWLVRPYQADAGITTPVGRPNFPAYPSAHSCLSAAAAGVLAAFFPSEADTLQAMVEEAGVSRIYAGLHFDFDITAGQELGERVAELAVRLAPRGHRPIPLD